MKGLTRAVGITVQVRLTTSAVDQTHTRNPKMHPKRDYRTLLFHGPSGTGKSMAVAALASELNAAYLVVDREFALSCVEPDSGLFDAFLEYATERLSVIHLDHCDELFEDERWCALWLRNKAKVIDLKLCVVGTMVSHPRDLWKSGTIQRKVWGIFGETVEFVLPTIATLQELTTKFIGKHGGRLGFDNDDIFWNCFRDAGISHRTWKDALQQIHQNVYHDGHDFSRAITAADFMNVLGPMVPELMPRFHLHGAASSLLGDGNVRRRNKPRAKPRASPEQHTSNALHELAEAPPVRTPEQLLMPSEATVEDVLTCPITLARMTDPVCASDGHTYERAAIEAWLKTSHTSPLTGAPLTHPGLVANVAVRKLLA